MKRFLGLLAMFVLLAGLLTMRGSQPTLAQGPPEPQTPRVMPRHRVGHRAKVDNLDELLAQGQVTDPLAGNYMLVDWDEIFLAWEGGDGAFNLKVHDVNEDLSLLGAPLYDEVNSDESGWLNGVHGKRFLDVAVGHFNDDNWADVVTAWESTGWLGDPLVNLSVVVPEYNGDQPIYTIHVGMFPAPQGTGTIRLATGDFDGDGYDEFVLAWEHEPGRTKLRLYDVVIRQNPYWGPWPDLVLSYEQSGPSPGCDPRYYDACFDMAAGDFDGNGDDEIAIVWKTGGPYHQLKTRVYDVDRNGIHTESTITEERMLAQGAWSVAAGDLDGDARDEIAVGWNAHDDDDNTLKAVLRVYTVSDRLAALTAEEMAVEADRPVADDGDVGVAAGDFNGDGTDEVLFAYATEDAGETKARVTVFDAVRLQGADWDYLRYKSEIMDEVLAGKGYLSVAAGDLDRNLREEIVMGWEGNGDTLGVKVYQVATTDLRQIDAVDRLTGYNVHGGKHLAVAVGNWDGDSIRVGRPQHWTSHDVEEVLAVIKAPPQHYDVIDGTPYSVNIFDDYRYSSYVSYKTREQQRTEMSLTTTRDWGISAGLEYTLGDEKVAYMKASLEASYGEGFEKTTSHFEEQTFSVEETVTTDDLIVYLETTYDVWEYPVYAETTDEEAGHFLVVFPRSPGQKNYLPGDDALSYAFYRPPNENLDLLSYSQGVPADYDDRNLIKGGDRTSLSAGSSKNFWLDWSTGEFDASKKSSNLSLSAGLEAKFGALGGSLKVNVDGSYSKGEISTHEVSFQDTTTIHIFFGPLQEDIYAYWIEPYVYWSTEDGHLVVDYAVGPKSVQAGAPLSTWWDDVYNKPDPTFNLPWKYGQLGEDYRLLSKGIDFEPATPTAGQPVTVTATVGNYSLIAADNVMVRFYRGDPDEGGVPIGEQQVIERLGSVLTPNEPAQVAVSVLFTDTAAFAGETLSIYAVVDPAGEIEEVHEDNNQAYGLLPVVASAAPPLGPPSLAIDPDNIAFDPETPALGETVRISATVEAAGRTFTFVPVEFWDGDPRQGGEFIGGDLIPMISAGETATASVLWDTSGKYGAHRIAVGVDYDGGREAIPIDNWAQKAIDLPLFRLYLPLLRKDVQ